MSAKPAGVSVLFLPIFLTACGGGHDDDDIDFKCKGGYPPGAIVMRGATGVARYQYLETAADPLVICEVETQVALSNLESAQSVIIIGRKPGRVSFPKLTTVNDSLSVGGEGIEFDVPSLQRVDSIGVVSNFGDNGWPLDLPLLTSVRELFFVTGYQGRVTMPLVEQAVEINTGGSLLDAPKLKEVETLKAELFLEDGVDLLPALEVVKSLAYLEIRGSTTATATLPALRSVPTLIVGDLTSYGRHVSLPTLTTAGRLSVNRMPELQSIDAPNLTSLMKLSVFQNPKLSECEIDDLVAQTQPSTVTIYDNGPACP